jgi:(2Fe-2S) ferredoxin
MFEELSLHILDIAMNSLAAGARTLKIVVDENTHADELAIQITDDGHGMDAGTLRQALERARSTKSARRKPIGLGLALLRQTAEMCDGTFLIRSVPGAGTTVTATMKHSHVDRPPIGDLSSTVLALCAANPDVEVQLDYYLNGEHLRFSSADLKGRNGDSMNLEELKKLKERAQRQVALREGQKKYRVVISMGTSGIAAGAREVMKTMLDEIEKRGLDEVEVRVTGEHGLEDIEPVIRIEEVSGEETTYARLDAEKARKIVAEHLQKGKKVEDLTVAKEKKLGKTA